MNRREKNKKFFVLIVFIIIVMILTIIFHTQIYPRRVSSIYGRCEISTEGEGFLTKSSSYTLIHNNSLWDVKNSTFNGERALKCFQDEKIGPVAYIYNFDNNIKIYCRYYYIKLNAFYKTNPKNVESDFIKNNISESINNILDILQIDASSPIKYGGEDIITAISNTICCGLNLMILSIPVVTFFFFHKGNYILKELFSEHPTKRSILLFFSYSLSFLFIYLSILMVYIFIVFNKSISYIIRIIIFILLGIITFIYIRKYEKNAERGYTLRSREDS
ncbi:MAG: hypothetical protein R6U61_09400 [Thermoplasmata archaeon]